MATISCHDHVFICPCIPLIVSFSSIKIVYDLQIYNLLYKSNLLLLNIGHYQFVLDILCVVTHLTWSSFQSNCFTLLILGNKDNWHKDKIFYIMIVLLYQVLFCLFIDSFLKYNVVMLSCIYFVNNLDCSFCIYFCKYG